MVCRVISSLVWVNKISERYQKQSPVSMFHIGSNIETQFPICFQRSFIKRTSSMSKSPRNQQTDCDMKNMIILTHHIKTYHLLSATCFSFQNSFCKSIQALVYTSMKRCFLQMQTIKLPSFTFKAKLWKEKWRA